ncbi:MAG: ATP-binding cassette domain-containing protein [Methanobacteriota archaeon]
MSAIEVEGLVKRYDAHVAVDGVTFSVAPGETLGIVGENGAGKTTTVEIVSTIRKPTAGSVRVLGRDVLKDPVHVRERIGVLPEGFSGFRHLTTRENVAFLAKLYGRASVVDAVIESVGLVREKDKPFRNLSAGNQRRVGIACALVNDPEVVFLDEPTASLDPTARIGIRELVARLQKAGKTIVITSHDLSEVQALADRVLVLHRGRAVDHGTPSELIARYQGTWVVRIRTREPERLLAWLDVPGEVATGRITVRVRSLEDTGRVLSLLEKASIELSAIEVSPPSLWDVFEKATTTEATA